MHVLLMRHDEWIGIKEIAEQAQVSHGLAPMLLE